MSFCRAALRALGSVGVSCGRARFCSKPQHLWKLGTDESLDHDYPTPWIGVVSEIMRNCLTTSSDFVDFYNCLSDKPLSMEEIEAARTIFSSGYLGPRFERAWLYASLTACATISHHAMGFSFLQYFLANKELQTPANYLAVLTFVASNPALSHMRPQLIDQMKADFALDDWRVCSSDLRVFLKKEGDWRTLLDLGASFTRQEVDSFFMDAFLICMRNRDLEATREVVAKYRTTGVQFPPYMVDVTIKEMNSREADPGDNTNLAFLDLVLQEIDIGVGSCIKHEEAESLVKWFSQLSPQWDTTVNCGTNNKGQCLNCASELRQFSPSHSELQLMHNDFREKTFLTARKLYSSESLLKTFERFINNCPPFDMVIDIQNLLATSIRSKHVDILFKTVSTLLEKYKPKGILFVGKYLVTIHGAKLDAVKHFVANVYPKVKMSTFNVHSVYKDDAFVLYAAIHRDAYLVSNDAYRDHLALLSGHTKQLWKQWLVSRQIVITRHGGITFPVTTMPLVYGSVAEGHLHIPHFLEDSNHAQSSKHAFVCLKRRKTTT